MSTTMLRTLTEKSKMKFGKYEELTVMEVLNIKAGPMYLMWVYYHSSMINFMPDILKKIHIDKDRIIPKPGKDPEKFDDIMDQIKSVRCIDSLNAERKGKRITNAINIKSRKLDRKIYSKKNLQAWNHGKR